MFQTQFKKQTNSRLFFAICALAIGTSFASCSDEEVPKDQPRESEKVEFFIAATQGEASYLLAVPDVTKGTTTISAQMLVDGAPRTLTGEGNGPIDAFVHALRKEFNVVFDVKDYVEHALSQGSEAMAVAYIEGADAEGNVRWGVGTDPSTITASLRAVLCAFERQGVTR